MKHKKSPQDKAAPITKFLVAVFILVLLGVFFQDPLPNIIALILLAMGMYQVNKSK